MLAAVPLPVAVISRDLYQAARGAEQAIPAERLLAKTDGIISRETWQEHQVSIASSYQLHQRDTEAWSGQSGVPAMERDAHYRRGDGMRCFLPEPGESEQFVFF